MSYKILDGHVVAPQAKNLKGQTFNSLTALRCLGRQPVGIKNVLWLCRCSCGNEVSVPTAQLIAGQRKRCSRFCKGSTFPGQAVTGG